LLFFNGFLGGLSVGYYFGKLIHVFKGSILGLQSLNSFLGLLGNLIGFVGGLGCLLGRELLKSLIVIHFLYFILNHFFLVILIIS